MRLPRKKRLPSVLTRTAATPASRLRSTPFDPPAVNHEKLCRAAMSTPPRLFAASMSTTRAVFALISSLLSTSCAGNVMT